MRFHEQFTYEEYLADGFVHGLGVAAAILGSITLVLWASGDFAIGNSKPILAYIFGLLASFILSAAYNMTLHPSARSILRRCDHAAIFLLIAGTYTPVALIGIGGMTGVIWASLVWSVAAVGICMKLFFFRRFQRISFMLTLMLGWIGVLMIGPMVASVSLTVLILLVTGGLLFSLGVIFHVRDHLPFNRAIWHVHVLLGATAHYAAVIIMTAN